MTDPKAKSIRFAVLGDLLLSSKPGSTIPGRGLEALSDEVQKLISACDIVFANLECTLPGRETVPTEPRVLSTEQQIRSIKKAGINVVTLANNHMFDCLDAGFQRLIDMLTEMEIQWCGAGRNIDEASQPTIIETQGMKMAFLGVVDDSSGPFRFADESTSGVAPLDTDKTCQIIEDLKGQVDHVVVSPHWGEERFRIPSPKQMEQAQTFINAGASMVLGHHPHVLQGLEFYRGAPIVYSLGNFLANDVYWVDGDYFTWNRFERTGCIFIAELDANGVKEIRQVPTFDDGETVHVDTSGWGNRCVQKTNRLLARGITWRRYRREIFRVRTIKPILYHLRWSELRKIRPRHLRNGLKLLFKHR